jgi:hypothetical protein
MTRVLVLGAAVVIAGGALLLVDPSLLFLALFVGVGGIFGAAYVPDALFGGTKANYD